MLLRNYWLIGIILGCARVLCAAEIITVFEHPIDIVYLWVDGNDPAWQSIKNSYLSADDSTIGLPDQESVEIKKISAQDGATDNRYMDNDELRYSLRSVHKYAPFAHHIYIVTMNQKPSWLAPHPKITIIEHKEIFKNLEGLPTFNSHAIESNLHRIPHLQEYFIYFNDDVFLGAPVTPEDFLLAIVLMYYLKKV